MSRATARRICLVTPGHLTSTPRLLKEASALVAAGWQWSDYRLRLAAVLREAGLFSA